MKKLLIGLLVTLALLLVIAPVAATPVAELSDLAQFFPADTPVFVANRIDSAYLESLDELLADVNAQLGILPPGMTLQSQLDNLAQEINPSGDFESTFGVWAGDTIAIGVLDIETAIADDFEGDSPVIIALAVTDNTAAEAFLDAYMLPNLVKNQLNEGTLYQPQEATRRDLTFYLTEGGLLITTALDSMSVVPDFDVSLADNEDFQAALGRLPQAEYNTVAYLDFAGMEFLARQIQAEIELEDVPLDFDFVAAFKALGGQAAGATIMGRSLVIDVASHIADPAALEAAGFNVDSSAPLQLDFTNNLPANTALFIQDTGFGTSLLNSFDEAYELGEMFEDKLAAGELDDDLEGLAYLDEGVTFMRLSFEGLSGLLLDEAFGWMTGDYILYLNVIPYAGNYSDELPFVPDLGMMIDATDGAAADAHVNGIETLLYELGLDTVREDDTLVLPLLGDMFEDDTLDLMLSHHGTMLISGTRSGVESALSGGGLTDTAAFQNASAIFLPDTQALAYINIAELSAIVSNLAQFTGDRDLRQVAAVLPIFESASITATYDDNGTGVARFALTLAGE